MNFLEKCNSHLNVPKVGNNFSCVLQVDLRPLLFQLMKLARQWVEWVDGVVIEHLLKKEILIE